MEKIKLQVFVSSTYKDLVQERQAAVEAILDAGHIPAGMELFKAGKSQIKTICKWIDDSDVYALILGGRYGSIGDEMSLSYTQLEYEYALSKGMPVFAVILTDHFLYNKASNHTGEVFFETENKEKYDIFKSEIEKNIVKYVNNIDQIREIIKDQIREIVTDEEYKLQGWIRNNGTEEKLLKREFFEVERKQILEEKEQIKFINEKLKKENEQLEAEKNDLNNKLIKMQLENCQMKKSFKSMQEELEGLKSENHQLKMSSMDMQERLEEFELENHQLKESSMSIEGQLKNKILLTDHGYKSTAYDIFFDEYAILEKGVYTPLYNSETSLLYGNICPIFEKYNLVERVKHSENGVGYKLTKEGISFYMNNKNKCE